MGFDMLYPNPFEINEHLRKARMLLGNKWVVIGDLVISANKNDCFIEVPDVEQWLNSREYLDDGTLDWAAWGPRMN